MLALVFKNKINWFESVVIKRF